MVGGENWAHLLARFSSRQEYHFCGGLTTLIIGLGTIRGRPYYYLQYYVRYVYGSYYSTICLCGETCRNAPLVDG